jgi:DNA polymerase delta subunit 1
MKRSPSPVGATGGYKKSRGEEEVENTFEDELLAMEACEAEAFEEDMVVDGEDTSLTGAANQRRWARPRPAAFDPATDALAIQWFDIDNTSGEPLSRNPAGGPVVGSSEGPVPIVRLFGVARSGASVMACVHGFTPYFLASVPASFDLNDQSLSALRVVFDQKVKERCRGDEKRLNKCVLGIERVAQRQSLLGYHHGTTKDFIKIYVALPSLIANAKRIIEDGMSVVGFGSVSGQTYESNVPFVLRFMVDLGINGSDWVEFPAGKYSVRDEALCTSRCVLEVDIFYNELVTHESAGQWSAIAPNMRTLSFDIECQGRKGHFPEATMDPVIQIASVVSNYGSDTPIIRNVFTLNSCLPIAGAQVISSETEEEMLLKWREFVNAVDPDLLTGYNIANFDIPYLLNRAKALEKKYPRLRIFPDFGRLRSVKAVMKDTTFQSSAFGKRENVETAITGRVIFDVLPYMYRNHKLSSYSLNSVSAEFLGNQKEDVHHSIISDLQLGSDADRRRLAVYCLKDAYLPQQLMNKLSVIVNYVEMARVTGVPLGYLLTRGQQIKVFSMLLRKCRRENLLIPTMSRSPTGSDAAYEGATVIEPKKAFYNVPIATLDFASLYPSIMQAYNLCYSTLMTNEDKLKLNESQYEMSPSGHCFVRSTTKKGILPQILDEILSARKRAKKDMAMATDPMEKAVQNGRQLALKISANSVYGFTGATVGQLPCLAIASSTTAYGRNLLYETRTFVEKTYTIANGYEADADVVYGDTDSVMVKFGPKNVADAMAIAEKAAKEVSAIFPSPISLEFEKIYYPFLLMNKKRYAGLYWTKPDKYDKLDTKGLETVRRDNCLLVRRLVDTCLRKILIEQNVQGAIDYAKSTISDLLQNKLDISMLVITKSLGKSADDAEYTNKQAHVELASRMKKRDAGSAPHVGDRVAYVIVQAAKGAPAYEKSEDPVYVLENNLPIDTEYYLTNQLSNPLTRIFEPIIGNAQSLLSGDHTRTVCKPTPTAKAGGIMMFAVKKSKCMGCKTPIPENSPLCENCAGKEREIYLQKMEDVNVHQEVYSKLWTECQRCQGSYHQDVICSNRDCPIFYKRKKVQIDLQAAQDALDRFTW